MRWIILLGLPILIGMGILMSIPNVSKKVSVGNLDVLEPTPILSFEPFSAKFEITTLGTKRVFSDSKYHNRSSKVYITATDPSVITISEPHITWQQFFDTMPSPMKVEPNCLYTGTSQKFCTNQTHELKFILNGEASTDALTQEISPDDFLVINYE
jgi:hypothetical protein